MNIMISIVMGKIFFGFGYIVVLELIQHHFNFTPIGVMKFTYKNYE